MMFIHNYCVHGIPVRLETDNPEISCIAETLLGYFEQNDSPGNASAEDDSLVLHVGQVPSPADLPDIPPSAECLFAQERPSHPDDPIQGWAVFETGDGLLIEFHRRGILQFNATQTRLHGTLVQPESPEKDIRTNLLHFSLVELVKRKGLFTVHAAGLEKDGRGILIPAFSGKGKTTACISLVRAGYGCLADDHPFVRERNGEVELLSFPEKVDVTDQTVQFFPELLEASHTLQEGPFKRSFDVHAIYPHAPVDVCRPAIILFPRVVEYPKSQIEPLSKSRALEELLPHGFRVLDKDVAKRHFQVLAHLVSQADCYRLLFGEDVLDLPHLVDSLIAGSAH